MIKLQDKVNKLTEIVTYKNTETRIFKLTSKKGDRSHLSDVK
jgi:hypothetical protein